MTKRKVMPMINNKNALILSYPLLASLGLSEFTQAQEPPVDELEEVVLVGTRGKLRSVMDSPAPVDVINNTDLNNQGSVDMSTLIRNVIPSYNVNDQPISDAATFIKPANLRGLAPDHTLVLVNGKRRHRAAVITWSGNGISNGSQGPDISAIPALAIKNVEVLRDGAAAQYGSDAIAGVMNFVLKDSPDGGTAEVRIGQYTAGDGEMAYVSGNAGLPLGDHGFANLTLEYGQQADTDRSTQRTDAQKLIDIGAPYSGIKDPAQVWGTPKVNNDVKFFANFGADITDNVEFYGYGNYNQKHIEGGFFFRNPSNRSGVYAYDNGTKLLVGDSTPNDGIDCPVVNIIDSVPDATALQAVVNDDNCFTFLQTLPGGFTPTFGSDLADMSVQAGIRGEVGDKLTWDISSYWGKNKVDFFINNTINASLGNDSPRDFDPGAYTQEDININADASYQVTQSLSLAVGAEYRIEKFTITPGESASYMAGQYADQGFSTSSNGFPGFSKQSSGSWSRDNWALYLDSQWTPNDDATLQAAIRFEEFEDFGSTFNGKLGANLRVTDIIGIRSTVSTGFKAPTPGQANVSNTTSQFTDGKLVNKGTIPPTTPLAIFKGGKPLEPEKSFNFSFGTYLTLGDVNITLDYFDISVMDRLNLSKEYALTPEEIEELIAEGISGADDMNKFRFFINDFDTRTQGVDLIVTKTTDWFGSTDWSLAYNYTDTKVSSFDSNTVDEERIRQVEGATPSTRVTLTGNHTINDFRVLGRVGYYSGWYDQDENDYFDGKFVVDLEGQWNFHEQQSILLGISNLFNEHGDKVADPGITGNLYSQYTPFGFNGRFLYAKYQYNW